MKDDEKYLLGASQVAGEMVPLDGISDAQVAFYERKWVQLGWVDADTGELTAKGKAARGGKFPTITESPAIEESEELHYAVPVAELLADVQGEVAYIEPLSDYTQGTYVGSPLLDDNELELDSE